MGNKGKMNCGVQGLPFWKRALDLACILVVAPGLVLLCAGVALLTRLGSSGPVFFRQRRVGYKGRQFVCYKFRTMLLNADTEAHRRHTQHLIRSDDPMVKLDARNDPRLVPLGALLRACGLDELPQILNILKGEMSLVGPRPCIPYEYELYEPWHRRRFDAVPGLTGLWQVSGKNRTTFDQMVRLDIEYSERLSLFLDLKILLKTIPALWGQYSDLRDMKRDEAGATARELSKSIQSYRYEN
jgi:lipopolysaccharide/colanic/teichoic acid biosynthesis glycosyltransferase